MTKITIKEIDDKSKADKFAEDGVTVIQTSWSILQCIGRVGQGLRFMTVELGTVAIVCCTPPTYFFWLCKPVDVFPPTIAVVESNMVEIILHKGDPAREFY